jgi:hypothetical protein
MKNDCRVDVKYINTYSYLFFDYNTEFCGILAIFFQFCPHQDMLKRNGVGGAGLYQCCQSTHSTGWQKNRLL